MMIVVSVRLQSLVAQERRESGRINSGQVVACCVTGVNCVLTWPSELVATLR